MFCPNCGHEIHGESSTGVEKCGRCRGDGRDAFGKLGPGCGGAGSVRVRQPAVSCAACKGDGQDAFGHGCEVCEGTGWAKV